MHTQSSYEKRKKKLILLKGEGLYCWINEEWMNLIKASNNPALTVNNNQIINLSPHPLRYTQFKKY